MAQPSTKVATLFTFIWLFLAPALHASAAGIVINNDAPVSNYQQVTLSLTSPYSGGEMSLMNDADSDWQPWVPFAATKRWQLSYNSGYKHRGGQIQGQPGHHLWHLLQRHPG